MFNRKISMLALLCLFTGPTLTYGMPNSWIEGTHKEILAKAGFNAPVSLSIERCGKNAVWRYLSSSDIVEAICQKNGGAETRMRVSKKPVEGDYVVFSGKSHEIYKSVPVTLKRRNSNSGYVRAEFQLKEYYYTLDVKPGTDHEAIMLQVRSVIDKFVDF